jgi:hypothetical protein
VQGKIWADAVHFGEGDAAIFLLGHQELTVERDGDTSEELLEGRITF